MAQITVLEPILAVEPSTQAIQPIEAVISEAEAKAFIYQHESGGRLDAVNPSSSACGIGQSLPCSKLESVCPDWRTNYECSDQFFTAYVTARYGSWVGAWDFWVNQGHNWY